MRPLAETLRETLRSLGIGGAVARAGAVSAWPAVAAQVLGADGARTRALRVEGDTIVVAVASPILAQELRLRAADVVALLARAAPDAGVRSVRFVPSA